MISSSVTATKTTKVSIVSDFVTTLKTELVPTFKEDISIYFDENSHEGLLETDLFSLNFPKLYPVLF